MQRRGRRIVKFITKDEGTASKRFIGGLLLRKNTTFVLLDPFTGDAGP